MKKQLKIVNETFRNNSREIADRNWHLLRYMTLTYLVCLVIYYILVCGGGISDIYSISVLAAIIAQAVYSAFVMLKKSAPRRPADVDVIILFFGVLIMALTIFLGTYVFQENNALLFPLMLIMMPQFYTLPPREIVPLVLISSVVFLGLSSYYKDTQYFLLDVVSIVASLAISAVSYYTLLKYKVEVFKKQAELNYICTIDPLTKVLNKMAFAQKYKECVSTKRSGIIAVTMIDLDNFKDVNDKHGHLVGDRILQRSCDVMLDSFVMEGVTTTVGRFGGDEFMLFSEGDVSAANIARLCERCAANIKDLSGEFGFLITCSIGSVVRNGAFSDLDDIIGVADKAMYEIKNTGGDSFKIVD